MSRNRIAAALAIVCFAASGTAQVQAQSERTLDEVKAEAKARADRGAYPLIGLKAEEVREALGRLHSLDRDEWAASWSRIGDRYMASKDYEGAWRYYSFARWPQPNSPGKPGAYEQARGRGTARPPRPSRPAFRARCAPGSRRTGRSAL